MNRLSHALAGLLFVLSAPAFAGELNVQGGSSTGGDQYTIRGHVGGLCRFSVTGAFNDVVTAQLGPSGGNAVFASVTIGSLATNPPSSLIRYSVERLPDGQTRILLGVPSASSLFNGGKVTLRRGNVVIDQDPVVLW